MTAKTCTAKTRRQTIDFILIKKKTKEMNVLFWEGIANKCFIDRSKQGIESNKNFWKVIEPFLENKSHVVVPLCLLMAET